MQLNNFPLQYVFVRHTAAGYLVSTTATTVRRLRFIGEKWTEYAVDSIRSTAEIIVPPKEVALLQFSVSHTMKVAVIGWHVFQPRTWTDAIAFPTINLPNAASESVDIVEGKNASLFETSYSIHEERYRKHVEHFDELEKKKRADDDGFSISFPFNVLTGSVLTLIGFAFDLLALGSMVYTHYCTRRN